MTWKCLFGAHRWRWFSLYDPGELGASVHLSQCQSCGKLAGGWRGLVNDRS
jgi:hypothetical protein